MQKQQTADIEKNKRETSKSRNKINKATIRNQKSTLNINTKSSAKQKESTSKRCKIGKNKAINYCRKWADIKQRIIQATQTVWTNIRNLHNQYAFNFYWMLFISITYLSFIKISWYWERTSVYKYFLVFYGIAIFLLTRIGTKKKVIDKLCSYIFIVSFFNVGIAFIGIYLAFGSEAANGAYLREILNQIPYMIYVLFFTVSTKFFAISLIILIGGTLLLIFFPKSFFSKEDIYSNWFNKIIFGIFSITFITPAFQYYVFNSKEFLRQLFL